MKEAVGSGPFKFAKDQWVPGSKAVYLKNAEYVPRAASEKAESFAGSKFPGVDRIELVWISDPQTAMSALINGEIDFYENPNIDFYPILEKAKGRELKGSDEVYARETVRMAKYPDAVRPELQVLRVGELAIAAIPCEVFTEIGLELKQKSPFKPTCVVSLANGYFGYLPTPAQHALGGYETWRARSSFLGVKSSDEIVKTLRGRGCHVGLDDFGMGHSTLKFLESHPFAQLHHRTPILVGGDFNDLYGTLGPRLLEPAGFRRAGPVAHTYPAILPVRPLDALYVRGDLQCAHCFPSRLDLTREASDHLPLVADLEMRWAPEAPPVPAPGALAGA